MAIIYRWMFRWIFREQWIQKEEEKKYRKIVDNI